MAHYLPNPQSATHLEHFHLNTNNLDADKLNVITTRYEILKNTVLNHQAPSPGLVGIWSMTKCVVPPAFLACTWFVQAIRSRMINLLN